LTFLRGVCVYIQYNTHTYSPKKSLAHAAGNKAKKCARINLGRDFGTGASSAQRVVAQEKFVCCQRLPCFSAALPPIVACLCRTIEQEFLTKY